MTIYDNMIYVLLQEGIYKHYILEDLSDFIQVLHV